METVFILIEHNAPNLCRSGWEEYRLIGVCKTWSEALEEAKIWTWDNADFNYVSPSSEDFVDNEKKEYYKIVYRNGDNSSESWAELYIKPLELM